MNIVYVYNTLVTIYTAGAISIWGFWIWHVLFVYITVFILLQIIYKYVV